MLGNKILRQRALLIAFILLVSYRFSVAQYYVAGQDPASLKWNQIETPNFKIIFPNSIDSIGQQLANSMEYFAEMASATLDHFPGKIPVILHNQTIIANGFVSWAPKRTEFYTLAPQDNEPGDWLDHLAIHEYRHVVQMDKMNNGITKFFSFSI